MKTIMNLKLTWAPTLMGMPPEGTMMVVPFSYLIVTHEWDMVTVEEMTGWVPNATMQMTFMDAMMQAGQIAEANIL